MSGTVGASQTSSDGGVAVERREYDWTAIEPSTAVMETVAAVKGVGPTTVGPLFDAIDPDALDAVVQSVAGTSESGADATVSFEFAGLHVAVYACGLLVVQQA